MSWIIKVIRIQIKGHSRLKFCLIIYFDTLLYRGLKTAEPGARGVTDIAIP
jgi:hypothetical protein